MAVCTRKLVKAAAIIVAVDGAPGGDAALAWALREARLRGSEVEAMVVRSMRLASREHLSYDEFTPARCEQVLAESLERVGGAGGVSLHLETRDDDLLFELGLEAWARGAGLIVVGESSHGPLRRALVPSTHGLTHRFSCPVVVVPSHFVRPEGIGRVVVDLEGAREGLGALRWAVEEAALTGAALDVVDADVVGLPGVRTGRRPVRTDLRRRVGETLARCRAEGIDATLHTRDGDDLAPAGLFVVDMPVGHRRRGLTCRAAQRRISPGGVPVVLVPAVAGLRM